MPLPENFISLHMQEEFLRGKAVTYAIEDEFIARHLEVVEQAMTICDTFRRMPTTDEDLKVIQILGMRIFNAFGASLKLALSGYIQNSALLMRDVLETVFLLDLFGGDRTKISQWRLADAKTLKKEFSLVAIRQALDDRYGHTSKKRHELYKLFSELAAHPTMKSDWMMRPKKDGDAVIGPFVEKTSQDAVLSEMGKLAVQAGQHLVAFFPTDWTDGLGPRLGFNKSVLGWFNTFYPKSGEKISENE